MNKQIVSMAEADSGERAALQRAVKRSHEVAERGLSRVAKGLDRDRVAGLATASVAERAAAIRVLVPEVVISEAVFSLLVLQSFPELGLSDGLSGLLDLVALSLVEDAQ